MTALNGLRSCRLGELLQHIAQFFGAGVAQVSVWIHGLHDDVIEARIHACDFTGQTEATTRYLACEHLIKHDAERIDIGRRSRRGGGAGQLRREVVGRAEGGVVGVVMHQPGQAGVAPLRTTHRSRPSWVSRHA